MNLICISILLTIFTLVAPSLVASGGWKATPEILATLPQYCWSQYIDSVRGNPDYQIHGCGVYSNHYCPGLVLMSEARNEKSKSGKIELLRMAKNEMEYTLRFTTGLPDCFLRPHAQANLERIKFDLEMLKLQRR